MTNLRGLYMKVVGFPSNLGVLVYAARALSWSLRLVMLLAECRRSFC